MQYFIGCSGFYNKDWKEVFYPKVLAQSKWFEFYCTQFNSLELNTTFYRFPTIDMLQKWYDISPADFRFSVKAPRLITHYKVFNETQSLLHDFYTAVREGLKEKVGTVLFQLPAKVEYSDELLEKIVLNIDASFNNVIEFRNKTWWNETILRQLTQHNISFCGVSIKDLSPEIMSTTPVIYYRFHGLKKLYYSEYTETDMQEFANTLKMKPADSAYIFFNNTATMAAINNARQLQLFLE